MPSMVVGICSGSGSGADGRPVLQACDPERAGVQDRIGPMDLDARDDMRRGRDRPVDLVGTGQRCQGRERAVVAMRREFVALVVLVARAPGMVLVRMVSMLMMGMLTI